MKAAPELHIITSISNFRAYVCLWIMSPGKGKTFTVGWEVKRARLFYMDISTLVTKMAPSN